MPTGGTGRRPYSAGRPPLPAPLAAGPDRMSRWGRTAPGPHLGRRHGGASPWRQHSLIRGSVAVLARLVLYTVPRRPVLRLDWRLRQLGSRQGLPGTRSLVNAFTNYRDVKGELRQKTPRVMDVT